VSRGFSVRPEIGQVSWLETEIAEISLLLRAKEASRLAALATAQRVTVGQLLRGLVREFLAQEASVNRPQDLELLAPRLWQQGNGDGRHDGTY
jgi:hypothetical protein